MGFCLLREKRESEGLRGLGLRVEVISLVGVRKFTTLSFSLLICQIYYIIGKIQIEEEWMVKIMVKLALLVVHASLLHSFRVNFLPVCIHHAALLFLPFLHIIILFLPAMTDQTPRKMLSHFKSTSYIQANTQTSKLKVRRDLSTISNHNIPTQRKNQDLNTFNKMELESYLPDINSKHRSQKRSSFLEMWLEEALDPQDGSQRTQKKTIEVEKTGPLRTVQKFQIDKKYLKSQNISGQVIDKLYNSLYVYTYGINNTFTEILALTKTSQHSQKRIVNSFWRAFVKLLEGCTSYRTAFQVIEDTYKKKQVELRDIFAVKEGQFLAERTALEQEVVKLTRKVSEQSYMISKLTNDYNIAESTLNLTDQAFNDQVNLRLKFQEKVNAVFTSYEEIRNKYDRLLDDLRAKGEEEIYSRQILVNIRAELDQSNVRNQQLNRQIGRLEEIIHQREDQIKLKRQEIYELTGQVKFFVQRKDQTEEEVRKIILKLDHFKQQNELYFNQLTLKTQLLNQSEKRIVEQQKLIDTSRAANQKVYEKYQTTGKLLGQFNAQRVVLQSQVNLAMAQSASFKASMQILQQQKNIISQQCKEYQQQLINYQKEVEIKTSCIAHNNQTIRQLQAIKDKFQRLYTITAAEKKKMEETMNEAVKMREKFQEEMTGMKMLLQNRNIELQEANSKLENEREVFRGKIASLKEEIAAKEGQILEYHDKQLQDQSLVTEATEKMKGVESQINALQEQKMKLMSDIIQKQIMLNQAAAQRKANWDMFKDLNAKLEQIGLQQKSNELTLANKQSVLQQIRGKADKEKELLRKMLDSYREDRQKKVAYIHPMLYEDCRMQIDRNTHKIESLNAKIENQEQENVAMRVKMEELEENNTLLKNGLVRVTAESEKKGQMITLLESQKRDLEGKLSHRAKENNDKQSSYNLNEQNYLNKIAESNQRISALQLQLKEEKEALRIQKEYSDKLQDQKKIQNIHFMAQEDQITNLKVEITRLKEDLSSFKRGDSKNSARTQNVKRKSNANHDKEPNSKTNERQSNSRMQERQYQDTPSQSNHDENHRTQEHSLKPIQEESRSPPRNNKVEIKDNTQARPSTVQRQAQTEKQRPKFSHSFKFQPVGPAKQSYGCQVDLLECPPASTLQPCNPRSLSTHKPPRIEGQEFKRALKITYMRR